MYTWPQHKNNERPLYMSQYAHFWPSPGWGTSNTTSSKISPTRRPLIAVFQVPTQCESHGLKGTTIITICRHITRVDVFSGVDCPCYRSSSSSSSSSRWSGAGTNGAGILKVGIIIDVCRQNGFISNFNYKMKHSSYVSRWSTFVVGIKPWSDAVYGKQLFGSVSNNGRHVTHKTIDVSTPGSLVDDVFVVVVTQAATQLFVVHLGLVLARAPASSYLVWVAETELPVVAGPWDVVLARWVQ